jgi:diacylglycerol kinase (ATP)
MRILFIMNPSSGSTDNEVQESHIKQTLNQANVDYRIFHTTGENDNQLISVEIENFNPDRVVACGGDGTVQLVARSLLHKTKVFGILPLGSANGLAKALNIPDKVEAALELIVASQHSIPLDLITVNNQICIHLSDIGTNALLVKNYEEGGDKGMLGYAKHLLPSIRESELMRYTITTSERTYNLEGYMLMMANANQFGTGVRISDGSVSDGKFEICNVTQIDLPSVVKAGLTAINVFVDKNMFSDVITCTKAEIAVNRKVHLQIDGEYIGEVDKIHAEIIPAALNILVPQ